MYLYVFFSGQWASLAISVLDDNATFSMRIVWLAVPDNQLVSLITVEGSIMTMYCSKTNHCCDQVIAEEHCILQRCC